MVKVLPGYYRLGNEYWVVFKDDGLLFLRPCGEYKDISGNAPYNLNMDALPKLMDYDLSDCK